MDATTLWLIVGIVLVVIVGLVGFVAVGRRRAWAPVISRRASRSHHEAGRRLPRDSGDEPSTTQVDIAAAPPRLSWKRSSSFRRCRFSSGPSSGKPAGTPAPSAGWLQ